MLDIKYILKNKDLIKKAVQLKKIDLDIDYLLDVYKKRKELINEKELINQKRNVLAKLGKGSKPDAESIKKGKELKNKLTAVEEEIAKLDELYFNLMAKVPLPPSEDTPIGDSEDDNVEVFKWGNIPKFNFKIKDHIELAENLDLIDFARGVKVAGYRGYYIKNDLALLQLGLMHYALKKVAAKGYRPFIPPTIVRSFALFGSGYFSSSAYNEDVDEIYKIANKEKEADGKIKTEEKFLIGTAEPSLLAYYADEILNEQDLPLRLSGFSPCYRSEIGSYGKDTKGLYRVHEFMKVEMVSITLADLEVSDRIQEEMISIAREMHEELNLPYRQLQICTGDLSAGKRRQYDLEVWLPSRNAYGETGSASNFLDWQSRRLNVRYKTKSGEKKYVYMLNSTALPTPRITIAILENYQQADGSIKVPEVLQTYVGKKVIKNENK